MATTTAAAAATPAARSTPHASSPRARLSPPHQGRPATRHFHRHRGRLLPDPIVGGGGTSWEIKLLARSQSAAWEGYPPRGARGKQPSTALGSTPGRVVRGTGACDPGPLAARRVRQSRSRCSLPVDLRRSNGGTTVKRFHQISMKTSHAATFRRLMEGILSQGGIVCSTHYCTVLRFCLPRAGLHHRCPRTYIAATQPNLPVTMTLLAPHPPLHPCLAAAPAVAFFSPPAAERLRCLPLPAAAPAARS